MKSYEIVTISVMFYKVTFFGANPIKQILSKKKG